MHDFQLLLPDLKSVHGLDRLVRLVRIREANEAEAARQTTRLVTKDSRTHDRTEGGEKGGEIVVAERDRQTVDEDVRVRRSLIEADSTRRRWQVQQRCE